MSKKLKVLWLILQVKWKLLMLRYRISQSNQALADYEKTHLFLVDTEYEYQHLIDNHASLLWQQTTLRKLLNSNNDD